jgi:hypothetical protein
LLYSLKENVRACLFFCFFFVLGPQAQKAIILVPDGWMDGWMGRIYYLSFLPSFGSRKKTYSVFIMIARQHPRPLLFLFDFSFFATTLPTYLSLAFPWLFLLLSSDFLFSIIFENFAVADNYLTSPTYLPRLPYLTFAL